MDGYKKWELKVIGTRSTIKEHEEKIEQLRVYEAESYRIPKLTAVQRVFSSSIIFPSSALLSQIDYTCTPFFRIKTNQLYFALHSRKYQYLEWEQEKYYFSFCCCCFISFFLSRLLSIFSPRDFVISRLSSSSSDSKYLELLFFVVDNDDVSHRNFYLMSIISSVCLVCKQVAKGTEKFYNRHLPFLFWSSF